MRRHRGSALALVSIPAVVIALMFGSTAAFAGGPSGGGDHHQRVVLVSVKGKDKRDCGSFKRPCRTISKGVAVARPGDTVKVLPGTYAEMVTVTKQLTIVGQKATVDATGKFNGFLLNGGASGTNLGGFTVKNAIGEGILAVGLSKVTIQYNWVTNNDQGATMPNGGGYAQCQAQGQVPGDCGEGIHLMSVAWSKVLGNQVVFNVGGILLTDEVGPNHNNLVAGNNASNNSADCGITLPSHNALATTNPAKGGVYNNLILNNTANNNGLKGEGAGILIAAAGPGMASYNNTIKGNMVSGNSLAGVTIHSHTPNQNVNGNVIVGNWVGTNNLLGDPDAGAKKTTGILVFSAVVKVKGTVITLNHISHNKIGIWLSKNVDRHQIKENFFFDVKVPVFVKF